MLQYVYVDANNCPNAAAETINVTALPQVLLEGLDTAYCYNAEPVTLVGLPPGGTFSGTAVHGGTFSPNDASPDSTYLVSYTYTDAFQCSATATRQVHLLNFPFVSLKSPQTIFGCDDEPVTLTVNIPGGILSGPGVTGDIFDPAAAGTGTHLITYHFTNNSGCTGADSLTMEVCVLGIADNSESSLLRIYPNPGNGLLTIENLTNNLDGMQLEVLTIEGKLLRKALIPSFGKGSRYKLDLTDYASGMYILKMDFNGTLAVKRVVVEK
jgi:hypothetical protein